VVYVSRPGPLITLSPKVLVSLVLEHCCETWPSRHYAGPISDRIGQGSKLEHAVKFLQLRGGDVNGDFEGVSASQLAVFPGTTHFFGLARTDLVRDVVITFVDAPAPTGWADR
jgi:hypothetical protein